MFIYDSESVLTHSQLKEQHPEIFATEESEKRLYFVIRLVLHEHSTRRSRYNRQNEKLGCSCSAATQKSPISMHNNKTNRQSKVESRHGAVWNRFFLNRFVVNKRFWQTIESEPIVVDSDDDHEMSVEPVSHILSQSKELRAGSERDNPGMSMSKSASQTLPRSNESSMSTKSQITHKKHDPNQYHDLNNFLETTMPPMTYLLDAFIEFGCVNADYLRAISTWSFEAIRGVLDRLSFGPDGKRLTEMEKFILQNHFKEYFTQLKKGGNTVHNSES